MTADVSTKTIGSKWAHSLIITVNAHYLREQLSLSSAASWLHANTMWWRATAPRTHHQHMQIIPGSSHLVLAWALLFINSFLHIRSGKHSFAFLLRPSGQWMDFRLCGDVEYQGGCTLRMSIKMPAPHRSVSTGAASDVEGGKGKYTLILTHWPHLNIHVFCPNLWRISINDISTITRTIDRQWIFRLVTCHLKVQTKDD